LEKRPKEAQYTVPGLYIFMLLEDSISYENIISLLGGSTKDI
jgi:hypothetical protein